MLMIPTAKLPKLCLYWTSTRTKIKPIPNGGADLQVQSLADGIAGLSSPSTNDIHSPLEIELSLMR